MLYLKAAGWVAECDVDWISAWTVESCRAIEGFFDGADGGFLANNLVVVADKGLVPSKLAPYSKAENIKVLKMCIKPCNSFGTPMHLCFNNKISHNAAFISASHQIKSKF